MRASMSELAIRFSSNRMLREYVESVYLPVVKLYRERSEDNGRLAKKILVWQNELAQHWHSIRLGDVQVSRGDNQWQFQVVVHFGDCIPGFAGVELYADPLPGEDALRMPMTRGEKVPGEPNSFVFHAEVPAIRSSNDYTVRVVPFNADASIPLEDAHILWQK